MLEPSITEPLNKMNRVQPNSNTDYCIKPNDFGKKLNGKRRHQDARSKISMESIRLSIILLLLPQVVIRSYSALYRTINKYGSAMQYAPTTQSLLSLVSGLNATANTHFRSQRSPSAGPGSQAKRKVEVRRFKASEVPSPER